MVENIGNRESGGRGQSLASLAKNVKKRTKFLNRYRKQLIGDIIDNPFGVQSIDPKRRRTPEQMLRHRERIDKEIATMKKNLEKAKTTVAKKAAEIE